jgi:glycosyltransferase involved in cell wall biosynthesis
LAGALTQDGVSVTRIDGHGGMRRAHAIVGDVRASAADLLHIQYPAVGYGRSLLPSVLPYLFRDRPVVITLHEFSIFRVYRLPWFVPFAYKADGVIFTSEAERTAFIKRLPRPTARLPVIGIGSNIPRVHAAAKDPRSICYFGLLMPGKGLESFLACARELRQMAPGWTIRLIGSAAPGQEAYAASIIEEARRIDVELVLDRTALDVAVCLSRTAFAYLPGPGGITERRGSVLAALENGVQVVGPLGDQAPAWLLNCVIDAPMPEDAARALAGGQRKACDPAHLAELSWDQIARRHRRLYEEVLQQP